MHPLYGLVGLGDQDLGQALIGLAGGHPHQIGHEFVLRIGGHVLEEESVFRLFRVGDQGAQILARIEGDAQQPAGIVGIAAPVLLGRLFQHQNPPGPLFPGRVRRRQGRIARTHHNDIVIRHSNQLQILETSRHYAGAAVSLEAVSNLAFLPWGDRYW